MRFSRNLPWYATTGVPHGAPHPLALRSNQDRVISDRNTSGNRSTCLRHGSHVGRARYAISVTSGRAVAITEGVIGARVGPEQPRGCTRGRPRRQVTVDKIAKPMSFLGRRPLRGYQCHTPDNESLERPSDCSHTFDSTGLCQNGARTRCDTPLISQK